MNVWSVICLLLTVFQSANSQYIEVLAKSNACFNAKTPNSTIFNAPTNGRIRGVKLVYNTGSVTCWNVRPDEIKWNKWGCIGSDNGTFYLNLIHVSDAQTLVGEAYYPKMNTDGFSLSSNNPSAYTTTCEQNLGDAASCGYHSYYLSNQNVNDTEIVWLQPSYDITTDDMFMLQYSEACCGYGETDNEGETCADVYFLYDQVLAEENVCFNAANPDESTIFNAPVNGEIIGAKLVYNTGSVTCWNVRPDEIKWSKWGCIGSDNGTFYLSLIHVLDAQTRVGEPYYPKMTTDGFSSSSNYPNDYTTTCEDVCGYHSYILDDQNVNDAEMVWLQPSYQITMNDMFMLQYSEACCSYGETDNEGTTCADIYFIYSKYDTVSPTTDPTTDPSISPTDYPTIMPSILINETASPAIAPVDNEQGKTSCKSCTFVLILIFCVVFICL